MLAEFAEAVTILAKYDPKGYTAAEHDEFFAGSVDPDSMEPADAARLAELLWRWDEYNECWARFV